LHSNLVILLNSAFRHYDLVSSRIGPHINWHGKYSTHLFVYQETEAVARFCRRFLELSCTRDAVSYQRFTVNTASRSPQVGAAVYDSLFAGAARSLETYLRANKLTNHAARDAELLLALTVTGPIMRLLYGADEPCSGLPEDNGHLQTWTWGGYGMRSDSSHQGGKA
jgi:hypothetical protein